MRLWRSRKKPSSSAAFNDEFDQAQFGHGAPQRAQQYAHIERQERSARKRYVFVTLVLLLFLAPLWGPIAWASSLSAYQVATEHVRNHPSSMKTFGEEPSFMIAPWYGWQFRSSSSSGKAKFGMYVWGNGNLGTVHVNMKRSGQKWHYKKLYLESSELSMSLR